MNYKSVTSIFLKIFEKNDSKDSENKISEYFNSFFFITFFQKIEI